MKKFMMMTAHMGVGLLPGPTGTYGSALTVIIYVLLMLIWPPLVWVFLAFTLTWGTYAANIAEQEFGQKDSGHIVIDEAAGQIITLLFAPFSFWALVVSFFMFRLFDIMKPFPIRKTENLPGGIGVMADDIAAGIFAGLAVAIIYMIIY